MHMKKVLALILAAVLALSMAACQKTAAPAAETKAQETTQKAPAEAPTQETEAKMPTASGKKVVIGTLANWVGLPAWYAYAEGYYKEVGLDVEIVNFGSQGTLVNEAMAADECDIAVSGMASVYALSTGMYTYIGDGCLTISGESLYARPDSDIYATGPDANGVYGSKETLKDVTILGPMNTTAQMNAIAYMQYFGYSADEFTFTNLDYSSSLAAFESGQGDLIAVNPPIRAGKAVVYKLFAQSAQRLSDGGSLYVVMRKAQGAESAEKELKTRFARVETVERGSGYRVFRAEK